MIKNKKIDERRMLSQFEVGKILLPPLILRSLHLQPDGGGDALIEVSVPNESEGFLFVVESKSRSTPESVRSAIAQVKKIAKETSALPMIQIPFLPYEKLQELEEEQISGVDLCGNGIVIIPGRLYVMRTGQPNQYRDSRPLANPYRGHSAVVARTLLMQPKVENLSTLCNAISEQGSKISISQVSKAIAALNDELIVTKQQGRIVLSDPLRLMDKLKDNWRAQKFTNRQAFRINGSKDWPTRLSACAGLRWAVTGESSVGRYATFTKAGPLQVAVNELSLARSILQGTPEDIVSFAEVELVETEEAGYYFANELSEGNMRYASRLQTWLELCHGDARQKEAARDLQQQIMAEIRS